MLEGTAPRDLRQTVASLLGLNADAILDDSNLIELGLDSITLMRLAGGLRRAGVGVDFAELAADPRVSAWEALLATRPMPASGQETFKANDARVLLDATAAFDLTPVQHAYWIGRRDGQVLGGVGCHAYFEFDRRGDRLPSIDPDRLERAVRALAVRHELLRARFLEDGRQQVLDHSPWPGLIVHDLRTLSIDAANEELLRVRERLSHRRLAVEHGLVFDAQLVLSPGGATRIHLDVDLLVADVLSIAVMLGDLARLYIEPNVPLPRIGYSFQTYLADQAALRAGERQRARAYWGARIDALPTGPQLPRAIEPAQVRRPRFVRRQFCFALPEWQRLNHRARVRG
ncbi:MAG TPA: condensation domain-containing protein, partial [Polyangiaceae bacterium]